MEGLKEVMEMKEHGLPMPQFEDARGMFKVTLFGERKGSVKKDISCDISDKNILIIEDIIDSGNTLSYLIEYLRAKNPKNLKIATLLDKPSRRVVDVPVDYIGFQIEDKFVLGFGLDFEQKYRNLPYIACVKN